MAKRPRLNNEKVPEVNAIENEASTSGAKNVEIGNVEVVFFCTLVFYDKDKYFSFLSLQGQIFYHIRWCWKHPKIGNEVHSYLCCGLCWTLSA